MKLPLLLLGVLSTALLAVATGCATSQPIPLGPYSRAPKVSRRTVEVDLGGGQRGTVTRSEVDLDDYIALINSVPIKNLDRHPVPLSVPGPFYPPELRKKQIEGIAEVYFIVDEKGLVERADVKTASNPAFGRAAVAAVLSWRFAPLTRQGKPVKVAFLQVFPFRLQ